MVYFIDAAGDDHQRGLYRLLESSPFSSADRHSFIRIVLHSEEMA